MRGPTTKPTEEEEGEERDKKQTEETANTPRVACLCDHSSLWLCVTAALSLCAVPSPAVPLVCCVLNAGRLPLLRRSALMLAPPSMVWLPLWLWLLLCTVLSSSLMLTLPVVGQTHPCPSSLFVAERGVYPFVFSSNLYLNSGLQSPLILPSGALRITTAPADPILAATRPSAAWMATPYRVGNGFQISFSFNTTKVVGQPQGFALVVQNVASNVLGTDDSIGLGYAGLPNGFAVEFDMLQNPGVSPNDDSSGMHIELHTNYDGFNNAFSGTRMGASDVVGSLGDFSVGHHNVTITFSPKTAEANGADKVSVSLDQGAYSFNAAMPVDTWQNRLPQRTAWIGFTGSVDITNYGIVDISNVVVKTAPMDPSRTYVVNGTTGSPSTAQAPTSLSKPTVKLQMVDVCGNEFRSSVTTVAALAMFNATVSTSPWATERVNASGYSMTDDATGVIKIAWWVNKAALPSSTYFLSINQPNFDITASTPVGNPLPIVVSPGTPTQAAVSPSSFFASVPSTATVILRDSFGNLAALPSGGWRLRMNYTSTGGSSGSNVPDLTGPSDPAADLSSFSFGFTPPPPPAIGTSLIMNVTMISPDNKNIVTVYSNTFNVTSGANVLVVANTDFDLTPSSPLALGSSSVLMVTLRDALDQDIVLGSLSLFTATTLECLVASHGIIPAPTSPAMSLVAGSVYMEIPAGSIAGQFRVRMTYDGVALPYFDFVVSEVSSSSTAAAAPIVTLDYDPCEYPRAVCGYAAECTRVRPDPVNQPRLYTAQCVPVLGMAAVSPETSNSEETGTTVISVTMSQSLPDDATLTILGMQMELNLTSSTSFNFILPSVAGILSVPITSSGVSVAFNFTASVPFNNTADAELARSLGLTRHSAIAGSGSSSGGGAGDVSLVQYTRIHSGPILLVNSSCTSVGTFYQPSDKSCLPCAKGAYCPGGTRSWPKPGWWSSSETQYQPTPCVNADACAGYDPNPAVGYVFAGDDSQCAEGYIGKYCSQCDNAHYLQDQVCRSCGLDSSARKALIATVIAAVVVFLILALGVAFIDDTKLVLFVTIVVFIQQCSFVGSIASSRITNGAASELFALIGLLNFEVSYFKLGCTVPQITVLDVFWYTIAFLLVAGVVFVLASGLFALTRSASYLAERDVTRPKVWSRRAQNSLTVLGVVIYLQLTTQFLKTMFCVKIEGVSVLQVEPTTRCYEGKHLGSAFFIWPAFFLFSIGFPLLCLYLVLRTRKLNRWFSGSTKFIYLYRGLRIRWVWFKVTQQFTTSFALALQLTLSTASNTAVRMSVAILFFAFNVFTVGSVWPYVRPLGNVLAIAGGMANALSGLALLTVMSAQVGKDSSKLGSLSGGGLFGLGIAVLAFFILLIIPARRIMQRYFPLSPADQSDDLLLHHRKYDELANSRHTRGLGPLPPTTESKRKRKTKQISSFDPSSSRAADSNDDTCGFGQGQQQPRLTLAVVEMAEIEVNQLASPSHVESNNAEDEWNKRADKEQVSM